MKRYLFVLLPVIILIACDTGSSSETRTNPLIGTWKAENDTNITFVTFTDNTFTSYFNTYIPISGWIEREDNGYYTYTDTIIFFEMSDPDTTRPYRHAIYKIYGNKLCIYDLPSGGHSSVLIKQ
jgi:hypothetical protein